MDNDLTEIAITTALKGDWRNAIKINKEILSFNPEDVDSLNRLSRAYFEYGDIINAKKTANKVISVDPKNSIALKSLNKYKILHKNKNLNQNKHDNIKSSDFIEEAGTSKHTELLNICSKEVFSTLAPGDELILQAHSHKVSVATQNNKYVGKVPDDLSAKLRRLTKNGYRFKVVVKFVENKCIKVIIKEIKRGKGYESIKSFMSDSLES